MVYGSGCESGSYFREPALGDALICGCKRVLVSSLTSDLSHFSGKSNMTVMHEGMCRDRAL